jgi:hypothetical protein
MLTMEVVDIMAMHLKVKNQEQALSLPLISNILDKKWLMIMLLRSPEKLPELLKV